MIPFRPADPYPLVNLERHTIAEMKAHAAETDSWLGLDTARVEDGLAKAGSRARAPGANAEQQRLWFGLDVQSLMTPYCELRFLLEKLRPRPGDHVVDMGAAYGRMAFVLERHFPGVAFTGYEYVGERVAEGLRAFKRQRLVSSRLEHADLTAPGFAPAPAKIYFIYDFGSLKAIEKALYDLRRHAGRAPLTVVGRGRHSRMLIAERHPWLEETHRGEPERGFTIYRARLGPRWAEAG